MEPPAPLGGAGVTLMEHAYADVDMDTLDVQAAPACRLLIEDHHESPASTRSVRTTSSGETDYPLDRRGPSCIARGGGDA